MLDIKEQEGMILTVGWALVSYNNVHNGGVGLR